MQFEARVNCKFTSSNKINKYTVKKSIIFIQITLNFTYSNEYVILVYKKCLI